MCRPERSSRREAKPSRIAESWLPLERTTAAPASMSRSTASESIADGVGRGQGAVVDVAGDEHRVDRLGAHDLDEVVEVGRLGALQPHLVEGPSQVPVGGVDHAHVTEARWGRRQPS